MGDAVEVTPNHSLLLCREHHVGDGLATEALSQVLGGSLCSTWKIDVGHGEVADVESDDSSGWMKEFILGGELSVDEGADAIPSLTVVEDDIEVVGNEGVIFKR